MAFEPAVEQWRPIVAKYFPQNLVNKALWVIQHESGGNPGAIGDGGAARGLFQIQDSRNFASRPPAAYLDNPENNIRYAAEQLGAAQNRWTDWGEGTTYNGQVFGALGNHPYPGDEALGLPGGNMADDWQVGPDGILVNQDGIPGTTRPPVGPTSASATGNGYIQYIMDTMGVTREQALQFLDMGGSSGGYDPLGPDKLAEDIFRDRRDYDYMVDQDQLDRDRQTAQDALAESQQAFDNAMRVGDFKAAQKAAEDLNYWKSVDAGLEQQRVNLTNQGQQLDYNIGLGGIAADRYKTDADLILGKEKIGLDAALGQQQNQTSQYDAETARLDSERRYLLGMANATTDAERAAVEERRRLDDVAIANMQGRNNFILGQQGNQIGAYNADTDRMRANQNYYASLANSANDAMRVGIEDLSRLDRNSQFNADQTNQFTLGQQGNQTNQFGAETDRANRMGTLALENNKFINEMANNPRDMFNLYAMQRGVAPDWGAIMGGSQPAQGSALAPSSVMNAYTPVTAAPTFDKTAAQSQAQQSQTGGYGINSNPFLANFEKANTATSQLPQFNESFQGATAQGKSDYDSTKNPFIGAQPGFQPTTTSPDFNYKPNLSGSPSWTGPAPVSGFVPNQNTNIKPPPKALTDINPGGLQGGVPTAGLQQGLNLSTVGGGDIKGSDFNYSAFYDEGMTQQVQPGDTIKGGSQVYVYYMPQGQQQHSPPQPTHSVGGTPFLASGGMTTASEFVTGDDPDSPDGLGRNAELNEPVIAPNGQYMGTRVTPLNPERRPLGKAWDKNLVRMAAGFGIRPANIFSKAA